MVVVRFIAKQMRSQCFQEILCLGRVNNTCSLPRRHLQSSHVCILSSVTSGFTIRKTESVDFRLRRIPYPQPMMFLCPLMYQTFSTKDPSGQSDVLSELIYDQMSENTLDILTEFFENLEELVEVAEDFDVTYSSGVLTIKVGGNIGTYVVNKQTPNKQLWLSSPSSGPKRYDLIDGRWIYKHDGISLYELLTLEFSKIYNKVIDFTTLERKEADET
ncbi:frataxin, mitochondrial-like isoform X1 [Ptychodera flava]|uniref:frataxin, mitochondrial-like isoform X1 n=1 Tax=Ptychodera flava TaxID=63121 RepID=UPI003969F044